MPSIAFLSTAHIHTRQYLAFIRNSTDGRRVAAIWDDNPARGRRYAIEAETFFEPDLDRLLGRSDIDGYIICAENTRHLELLKKVLPLGKPVLCEKPLVAGSEALAELRTLVGKRVPPLCCGYFLPFTKEFQAVAKLVEAGSLGTVTRAGFVNAHAAAYLRWFDDPDLQWFTDPNLSGGGALMDLGTHGVHLLRTLLGPVEKVWATAENHSGVYPATDDYGLILLKFRSGVLGRVEAAWTQTGGSNGLTVIGSQGAVWNTPQGYVMGRPRLTPEPLPTVPALPDRVDRLVAMIRGEIPCTALQADFEAVCDSVTILDAAYRSAQSGEWVAV